MALIDGHHGGSRFILANKNPSPRWPQMISCLASSGPSILSRVSYICVCLFFSSSSSEEEEENFPNDFHMICMRVDAVGCQREKLWRVAALLCCVRVVPYRGHRSRLQFFSWSHNAHPRICVYSNDIRGWERDGGRGGLMNFGRLHPMLQRIASQPLMLCKCAFISVKCCTSVSNVLCA